MSNFMNLKALPLLIAIAGFVAAPSAGAETPSPQAAQLTGASIVVHESNGKTTVIPVDDNAARALLSDPQTKPVDASIIVFSVNNATYMIRDHAMPSGDMMVASILRHYVPPQGGG